MGKFKILLNCILLLFFKSIISFSADSFQMPLSIGVYGGLNLNFNNPDFTYKNVKIFSPEVKFILSNTSVNLNAGGIANIPLNNIFVFSGRFGYNGIGSSLNPALNNNYNRSKLESIIHYLELTPLIQFHNLLPVDRLYLLTGLEIGIPISSNHMFSERDVNLNNTVTVDEKIPNASLRLAAALGIGYVFNLSEKIMLAPEASFRLPFTNVSSAAQFKTWDVPQFRLGASLLFELSGEKTIDKESFLDVGFTDIRYYNKEGNKYPLKKITVEEVQYKELYPFIPYVFCEENFEYPSPANQILAASSETGEFNIQNLETDALKINTHTMDIIGTRMNQLPEATLIITGTNNGLKEAGNKTLSIQRAEFAKNYLVINYGISQDRIRIEGSGLPLKPSAINDPDGMKENSRIEFRSSNKDLLAPILIEKDKQAIADPNLVEFVPYAVSSDSITNWELEVYQADRELLRKSGTGQPDSIKWSIAPNQLSASEIPVEYNFKATNEKGLNKNASGSVPVEFISISRKKIEDKPDRTISKFSLIVFDFDKADVSEYDKEIIEKNILPEIKYNSTVQIYGYTDRIGNEDYNRKLSERRATTVKDILSLKAKSAKYETYGVGENNILFDNDSPIGRQLSRTVQVYVITPKE